MVASDPAVKGGVPVIRGTRIAVYSVEQRLDGGETVDDLAAGYPGVPREASAVA